MFDYRWLIENTYLAITMLLTSLLVITNLLVFCRLRTTRRLVRFYEQLLGDYQASNIRELLQQVSKLEKDNHRDLDRLSSRVAILEQRLPNFINRLAIRRFKGFPDVGGDLSFSLALLSDQGNGVVITGLHGREETRLYAKPVTQYTSTYQLSEEEEEVLKSARNL